MQRLIGPSVLLTVAHHTLRVCSANVNAERKKKVMVRNLQHGVRRGI